MTHVIAVFSSTNASCLDLVCKLGWYENLPLNLVRLKKKTNGESVLLCLTMFQLNNLSN